MKVHHLNCATMCPRGARFVNGTGGLFARGHLVCHCLLVESNDGLVLVDSGLGTDDIAHPDERTDGIAQTLGATLDVAETARERVRALGFRAQDVRHVVLTHLDFDHCGGLSDFPAAEVHLMADEHAAALAPKTWRERRRYRAAQWAHGPRWTPHAPTGERWNGFDAVCAIDAVGPELLLLPLAGHSRGHAAVAVRAPGSVAGRSFEWLVHAGDAYFDQREMDPTDPRCPVGLRAFQRLTAVDDEMRRANAARLRDLARAHAGDVRVFCAHCAADFDLFSVA